MANEVVPARPRPKAGLFSKGPAPTADSLYEELTQDSRAPAAGDRWETVRRGSMEWLGIADAGTRLELF